MKEPREYRPQYHANLTDKETIWLNEYLKHGNSAKAAGVAYPEAKKAHRRILGRKVRERLMDIIADMLETHKMTDAHMAKVLYEASKANKVLISPTGEKEIVPDHRMRVQAAVVAGRWKKHEKPSEVTVDQRDLEIVVHPSLIKRVQEEEKVKIEKIQPIDRVKVKKDRKKGKSNIPDKSAKLIRSG